MQDRVLTITVYRVDSPISIGLHVSASRPESRVCLAEDEPPGVDPGGLDRRVTRLTLIQLVALMALLVPLRFGQTPRAAAIWFRLMRSVQPWGMAEVLMLGVLVALVKLAHMAEVIPGIALWSLGALVMLLAACVAAFDPRALWAKVDAAQ